MPNRRKLHRQDLDAVDHVDEVASAEPHQGAESPATTNDASIGFASVAGAEASHVGEAGSGMATGRRQHEPILSVVGDDGPVAGDAADRVYQKIEWTWEEGGIMAGDDLESPDAFSHDGDPPDRLVENQRIAAILKIEVAPTTGNIEDLLGGATGRAMMGSPKIGEATAWSLSSSTHALLAETQEGSIEPSIVDRNDDAEEFREYKELDLSAPVVDFVDDDSD